MRDSTRAENLDTILNGLNLPSDFSMNCVLDLSISRVSDWLKSRDCLSSPEFSSNWIVYGEIT